MTSTDDSKTAEKDGFEPLFTEHYNGDEYLHIDRIQEVWRRSLQLVFPKEKNVYDLLLCCREVVLNALVHGCDKAPGKTSSMQVSCWKDKNLARVRVDDPGLGHRFDPGERLRSLEPLDGTHLGLAMVKAFSKSFAIENGGSTVTFEFEIKNKR